MADDQPQPLTATVALERLGRMSLREHSMDSLLRSVVGLTRSVMAGDTEVSVTLLVDDVPTTVVGWSLTSSVTDASGLPGSTVLARSAMVCSRSSIDTWRRDSEPRRSSAWTAGIGEEVWSVATTASGLLIPKVGGLGRGPRSEGRA